MPRVFLSYGHEDIAYAQRLERYLTRAGADVWVDFRSLAPGDVWRGKIVSAIRESDFFLLLLSTRSVDRKGFFHREIREALDVMREIPSNRPYLIPARLDECDPPQQELHDIQRVDLFPSWTRGARRVVKTICPTPKLASTAAAGQYHALINIAVWPHADCAAIASRVSAYKYIINAKPTDSPKFPIIASFRGEPSKLYGVGRRIQRIPDVLNVSFIVGR
jgi:hypothetical protein